MRGAPFGLRPYRIRNPLETKRCRERPVCRSVSGECYLITGCTIPYTSAEIPPAGAPSGFDSAAMVGFMLALAGLCRSAQNDTEGMAICGM